MVLQFDRALGVSNPTRLHAFWDIDVLLARNCPHLPPQAIKFSWQSMCSPFDCALGVSKPTLLHAFRDLEVLLARNCQHFRSSSH